MYGDVFLFFFKQKTAYEIRISDWSSDVCSSDLIGMGPVKIASRFERCLRAFQSLMADHQPVGRPAQIAQFENDAGDGGGVVGLMAVGRAEARLDLAAHRHINGKSSEERRVGKECVSTCRSRWSPYP